MTTKPQSTLEPCPNPYCQSAKATPSSDFSNYYIYCPCCFLRGPRESVDHFGARWDALPRFPPASPVPVVNGSLVRLIVNAVSLTVETVEGGCSLNVKRADELVREVLLNHFAAAPLWNRKNENSYSE